jgi:hypothetical protein
MEAVTYGRKKVSVAVKWDKQTGLASLQSKPLDEKDVSCHVRCPRYGED